MKELQIRVTLSRRFLCVQIGTYLLAGLAMSLLPISLVWQIAGGGVLLFSLCVGLYRQQRKPAVIRYVRQKWFVSRQDGIFSQVKFRDAFVSRYLVMLCLHNESSGNLNYLITADTVSPDDYRRLCVILRCQTRP